MESEDNIHISSKNYNPTIRNAVNFNANNDAEVLKQALTGIIVDKESIIDIMCTRGVHQRCEIATAYKTLFGKDLLGDIKSKLSGNLKKLVKALITPLPQYYAKKLCKAMRGCGTDEKAIIEILCTLSNQGIRAVSRCYEIMYNTTLEKDLIDDTSGHFRRLCVSLSMGRRNEDIIVDEVAAKQDTEALYKAGVAKWGTGESVFNKIFATRSYPHLRKVFSQYQLTFGHDILTAINSEFSGDIRRAFTSLVKCIINKPKFFAELLYKSMKGAGTDNSTLIRIIVSRSEIDLGDIKEEFRKIDGKSLEHWISNDTSGNYRRLLLAIIAI